ATAARKATRQRRDHRRKVADVDEALAAAAGHEPTPSQQASVRELLERARQHLSAEELALAELRAQGLAWADIANQVGGKAQARRMQLARAVERVARELGLDDDADG